MIERSHSSGNTPSCKEELQIILRGTDNCSLRDLSKQGCILSAPILEFESSDLKALLTSSGETFIITKLPLQIWFGAGSEGTLEEKTSENAFTKHSDINLGSSIKVSSDILRGPTDGRPTLLCFKYA